MLRLRLIVVVVVMWKTSPENQRDFLLQIKFLFKLIEIYRIDHSLSWTLKTVSNE